MHSIELFWNIGKQIYLYQHKTENICEKLSHYYSYAYGNSHLFSLTNIHYMRLLFLDYPVFYHDLEKVSWKQYCLLFQIINKKERYFYYRLCLWFRCNDSEFTWMIHNHYYQRLLSFDI